MDNFMEKIAQKLNSQDMIRANSAADAAELDNVKNQITLFKEQMEKYDDCLQEMRRLNLRNIENAKSMQEFTEQAGERLGKTAGELESASVSKIQQTSDISIAGIRQTSDASIAGIKETSDVSIAGINQTVEESLAKITRIREQSEELEKISSAMSQLQEKIEQSFKSLEDFSHTDNVKVYRNVQASVIEELEKQTQELMDEQKRTAKNNKLVLIFGILSMVLAGVKTGLLAALAFGLF